MTQRIVPLFVLGLLTGCMAPVDEVGADREAIVNGTLGGAPEVVFMYRLDGAACTGSIIAPRIVLTANHCVEVRDGVPASPGNFRIYVGNSTRSLTAEYLVSEVRPVPNAGIGAGGANDVALLILSQSARETPVPIGREDPRVLFGEDCLAVGYGQTPSGGSGTKYHVTTRVTGIQQGLITVPPTVCQGDSGGPLLGPDGAVYGVASFIFSPDGRTEPRCGTAPGAYNQIIQHLPFIDAVLEETGSCAPSEEVCDGGDNDCDETVDEGCTPLGDPCSIDTECTGGQCRETPTGRICTAPCDPLRPAQGCSPGFYCAADGCSGHCLRGEAGEGRLEADCEADTDCVSLFCKDPGDGRRRCLEPCRGNAGLCLAGEVCTAAEGNCGGCVPEALLFERRGLGEPCEDDASCVEGMVCHEVGGIGECARPCTGAEDECGEVFVCRDELCVRDRTQGVGGVCAENADCGAMGICAAQSGRRWCTAPCATAEECPSGFDCVPAGGTMVCAPAAALLGESCVDSAECASGTCATVGGMGQVCTSFCDARTACAPGFECVRADGAGANVCIAARVEAPERGGCGIAPGRSPLAGGLAALGFALALVWRRRRGFP